MVLQFVGEYVIAFLLKSPCLLTRTFLFWSAMQFAVLGPSPLLCQFGQGLGPFENPSSLDEGFFVLQQIQKQQYKPNLPEFLYKDSGRFTFNIHTYTLTCNNVNGFGFYLIIGAKLNTAK